MSGELYFSAQSTIDGHEYLRYSACEPMVVDGIVYERRGSYCEGMMISVKLDNEFGGVAYHCLSQPASEAELDNWVQYGDLTFVDELPTPEPPAVIDESHTVSREDIARFMHSYARGGIVPLRACPDDHVVFRFNPS